jgi:uncharacterized HhH-GPD family protein
MKAHYPFTPNERANKLVESDATAFLIAMCLDQQVRTEKAFAGPFVLRERIGTIDARKIAGMRPAKLKSAFRTPPAIHRYPGMMAKRVRSLCKILASDYGGKGGRVLAGARSVQDMFARLIALPGFGEAKAQCAIRILGKFGGMRLPGWRNYASDADLPWVYKNGRRT